MAAHRDPRLQELATCGKLRIAACYPRAVTGLFQQAGAPLPESTVIFNMRSQTAEDIAAQMLESAEIEAAQARPNADLSEHERF